MSEEKSNLSGAENPEDLTGLKQGKIKKVAAGLPAVISSVKQVFGEAGVVRGLTALWHLNKKEDLIVPAAPGPIRTTSARVSANIVRMALGPWLKKPLQKN